MPSGDCSPPVAPPRRSNARTGARRRLRRRRRSGGAAPTTFAWLSRNAGDYGFYNLSVANKRQLTGRAVRGVLAQPAVRSALESLPRPAEPSVRWLTPDQWHVASASSGRWRTLICLRCWPRSPGSDRCCRVRRSSARPPHDWDEESSPFPRYDLLGAAVRRAAAFGAPPEPRPFTGHLSIARARGRGGVPGRVMAHGGGGVDGGGGDHRSAAGGQAAAATRPWPPSAPPVERRTTPAGPGPGSGAGPRRTPRWRGPPSPPCGPRRRTTRCCRWAGRCRPGSKREVDVSPGGGPFHH